MKFKFKNSKYVDLYENGKTKKLSLPKGLPKKFFERMNRIGAAVDINDLREPPSMHFEKLQGFEDRFSIKLNDQYRLVFEIDFSDEERLQGKVTVIGISKHYDKVL